jgi:hypothetical protein
VVAAPPCPEPLLVVAVVELVVVALCVVVAPALPPAPLTPVVVPESLEGDEQAIIDPPANQRSESLADRPIVTGTVPFRVAATLSYVPKKAR